MAFLPPVSTGMSRYAPPIRRRGGGVQDGPPFANAPQGPMMAQAESSKVRRMPDQRQDGDSEGAGANRELTSLDDPDYGADNKIFTREQALEARARLRELLARPLGRWVGLSATVLTTAELIERLTAAERTRSGVARADPD